jgi:hypothetical protein
MKMQHIKPQEPVLVVPVHDNKEVGFFGITCLRLTAGKEKSTIKIKSSVFDYHCHKQIL